MNAPSEERTSGSIQVRQVPQGFELEGASRIKRFHDNHGGIAEPGSPRLPYQPGRPRYVGLVLKIIQLVLPISMMVAALIWAYNFAEKEREELYPKLAYAQAIHPLYYNGYPMANKPARDIIAANMYRERWYRCIGEGETTVFLWTLLFLI